MKKGISVIICCYNSAGRLPETLRHLSKQKLPETINWEVVVVNNSSTDDTSNVAQEVWASFELAVPLKIIPEPTPGLSNARRAGVKNASFDLIVFCDDDNWLASDYLKNACEIMQQNLNVGVLGGRSEGVFESEPPEWFERFSFAYAIGKQLPQTGIANKRRYLMGAGMVVRKSILDLLYELSFNNILTDRKGDAVSSGGDTELCLMILFLGYDLYYDERLFFHHFITSKRLNWQYCKKMLIESYGSMQIYLSFYKMIYKKMKVSGNMFFEEAYREILWYNIHILLNAFKGIEAFRFLRLILFSKKKSTKPIEFRGNIKRISYLILKKNKLMKEFEQMKYVIEGISKEKERLFTENRECFLASDFNLQIN